MAALFKGRNRFVLMLLIFLILFIILIRREHRGQGTYLRVFQIPSSKEAETKNQHLTTSAYRTTNTRTSTKYSSSSANVVVSSRTTEKVRDAFLVKTSTCHIPNFKPWHETLTFLKKGKEKFCRSKPDITRVSLGILELDKTVIKKDYKEFSHCRYQAIKREVETKDNVADIDREISPNFSDSIKLSGIDQLKVTCFDKSNREIYRNYHAVVRRKSNQEMEMKKLFEEHSEQGKHKKMNVLMLGVDSVSRLNFLRQMPDTAQFLETDMDAYELSGYNKVADNTFVNIVPMFTGKFLEELPWNETLANKPFDPYPLMWKDFKSRGYWTLFGEDAPKISIFNYVKYGFHRQPTDYYGRIVALAMESDKNIWSNHHHCINGNLETVRHLEYLKDFMSVYESDPYFAFMFLTRLSHDSIEATAACDPVYLHFFNQLRSSNLINNTAIIFFSDHGIRYGKIRETYVGKLEERLPFMYIILPEWFKKENPDGVKNLKVNKHRLTTPFDIYATVQHILSYPHEPNLDHLPVKARSVSLLTEVPENRDCEQAGILPHWCTCQSQEHVAKNDSYVQDAAQTVVHAINLLLSPNSNLCSKLELKSINDARRSAISDTVLKFKNSLNDVLNRKVDFGKRVSSYYDYLVTLSTTPGDALFESTVRYNEQTKEFSVQGDISRINMYGNQSACIDNFVLKKYCYCEKL